MHTWGEGETENERGGGGARERERRRVESEKSIYNFLYRAYALPRLVSNISKRGKYTSIPYTLPVEIAR